MESVVLVYNVRQCLPLYKCTPKLQHTHIYIYIYIEEKPSDFERWGKREALSGPRGEGGVGGPGGNLLPKPLWVDSRKPIWGDLRKLLWVALNWSNQNFLNSFTTP